MEPSVLVKLFKIEEGSSKIIDIINAIDTKKDWAGVTSVWSLLEVARALRKDGKPRDLIVLDLKEMRKHRMTFAEIVDEILQEAEQLVASREIYASDALHAATYRHLRKDCDLDGFLCDDKHFERLRDLVEAVTIEQVRTA